MIGIWLDATQSSRRSSSFVDSLKFLMPLPRPRPISGSRLAPKSSRMMIRMMMSSGIPRLPNMNAPSVRGDSPDCTTPRWTTSLALAAAILAIGLAAAPAARQFTSGVNVVEVYVSVTDSKGAPLRGLTREDFELAEDGRPQSVTTFVAGEFPLTVALAVDASFSMAG